MTFTPAHRIPAVATATAILLVSAHTVVWGEDTGHRQHGAHVHGLAHLHIAAEGQQVLVDLTVPGATLVGYERPPRTPEEHETLEIARRNLEAGDAMIRFSTHAACRLESAQIDLGAATDQHAEGHTDVRATYRFNCDHPGQMDSAALGLFAGFPALERVFVHYITDDGHGSASLTPRNPVVVFIPF